MTRTDEAALAAAQKVEDIFCRSFPGGRVQRLAAIQVAIVEAIEVTQRPTFIGVDFGQGPDLAACATFRDGKLTHLETDEHRSDRFNPPPAPATPPASSSAMASDFSDVGAAPAVIDERPPQPIAQPAEAEITMGEQVLRLWSTTHMTREEISASVGCKLASVDAFLTTARSKGDRRGHARRTVTQTFGAVKKPDADRAPPISGFSGPPRLLPAAGAQPAAPIPVTLNGTFDAMGVVAIDTRAHIIRGPLGDWQASAPVARTLKRMNDGMLYDRRTLLEAGPWPGEECFASQFPSMTRHLAAIGIELVDVKKAGCRIRVSGT